MSGAYWPPNYWFGLGVVEAAEVVGAGKPRRFVWAPEPDWYAKRTRRGDDIIKKEMAEVQARRENDQRQIEERKERLDNRFRLKIAEEQIDVKLEKEAAIAAILQGEQVARRNLGIKKQRLLNLELAKMAKEKEAQEKERIRQQRLKNLKKARAAKKRKRKKK